MQLYRYEFCAFVLYAFVLYVRMTTGVALPVQTCQREPPSISNKSLQSDENDLQPYITVLSPQLARQIKWNDHECSILGIHSSKIQRSLDEANVCHKYWRIWNQLTSFFSMQVAKVGIETKDLLNIMPVRYILYLACKQSAVRTEMFSHLNCVTEVLQHFPGGWGADAVVVEFQFSRVHGWCSVRRIFFRDWAT